MTSWFVHCTGFSAVKIFYGKVWRASRSAYCNFSGKRCWYLQSKHTPECKPCLGWYVYYLTFLSINEKVRVPPSCKDENSGFGKKILILCLFHTQPKHNYINLSRFKYCGKISKSLLWVLRLCWSDFVKVDRGLLIFSHVTLDHVTWLPTVAFRRRTFSLSHIVFNVKPI